MEVFRFNQEIESGKLKLKTKDNEIDALRNQLTKSERERDNLIVEKSEIVRGLQERLDASQKRLAQSIAEVSKTLFVSLGLSALPPLLSPYVIFRISILRKGCF